MTIFRCTMTKFCIFTRIGRSVVALWLQPDIARAGAATMTSPIGAAASRRAVIPGASAPSSFVSSSFIALPERVQEVSASSGSGGPAGERSAARDAGIRWSPRKFILPDRPALAAQNRISLARRMQGNTPLVRAASVLEHVDSLPGSEHCPSADDWNQIWNYFHTNSKTRLISRLSCAYKTYLRNQVCS